MFDKLKASIKRDTASITAPIEKVYAELVTFIASTEADIKANEAMAAGLFTKNEAIKLEQAAALKIKATLEMLLGKAQAAVASIPVAPAPVMTAAVETPTNGAGVILTGR